MRASGAMVLLLGVTLVPGIVGAQANSECLVSLTASAPGATVSRGGTVVTATADATGWCTFTLTACVNDTTIAGCDSGNVNRFILLPHDGGASMTTLESALQAQLPTTQRTCSQTTFKVGQTLHRRLRTFAASTDGRRDTDTLTLNCQCGGTAKPFTSTFQGIQSAIFDRHKCNDPVCHGSAQQGGLDLTAGVSYQNLFEVKSSESQLNRVQPGDKDRSLLWLKLAAKTDKSLLPPGFQVPGAPMPNNNDALTADELEAIRLWIYSGAPSTGTVAGTDKLLNACMAPPQPLIIKPLEPPTASKPGIQFVMPPWKLEAHSEHEICFATYYDITSQVPEQYQDPSHTLFRFSEDELRQDPQSHHLLLNRYIGSADNIHDLSLGTWACNGGPTPGQICEPTDLSSCGSGTCTSEIQQSFACLGFGPPDAGGSQTFYAIGGAQTAQADTAFVDSVFAQIPMKGILYWNSHAFNLTDEDTVMHARLNYYFAKSSVYPVEGIFDTSRIFAPNAAPYKTQTICNDYRLPQGARLFNLSSHTHKHGKHFTISAPNNVSLYENFVYNDPASLIFDPPLAFDSPNQADRILHYCSLYNNGVAPDGSPDPTTVTRYSHLPKSAQQTIGLCSPTACAAGRVGKPCRGVGDDRTCDSAAGMNDGFCDACPITGGESTENEMFILIGNYYIDPAVTGGAISPAFAAAASTLDGSGRSLSTEVVLPPQIGCSSSHAGHAAHAAHTSIHAPH